MSGFGFGSSGSSSVFGGGNQNQQHQQQSSFAGSQQFLFSNNGNTNTNNNSHNAGGYQSPAPSANLTFGSPGVGGGISSTSSGFGFANTNSSMNKDYSKDTSNSSFMPFGTSSNLAQPSTFSSSYNIQSTNQPFSSPPVSSSASSSLQFGISTNINRGNTTTNDNNNNNPFAYKNNEPALNPFANPFTPVNNSQNKSVGGDFSTYQQTSTSLWSSNSNWNHDTNTSLNNTDLDQQMINDMNDDTMIEDDSNIYYNTTNNASNQQLEVASREKNEELARLKARLEKKKQRMLEMKQKAAAAEANTSSTPSQFSSSKTTMEINHSSSQPIDPNNNTIILSSNKSSSLDNMRIPKKIHHDISQNDDTISNNHERHFFENNKNNSDSTTKDNYTYPSSSTTTTTTTTSSLVGICLSMCPEEELERRINESDIQALELYHPSLHPQNWTLKDTAVKRFRRSAADYKLDIPELVRPPYILEQVCAYLEEWVMERDRQGKDPRFGTSSGLEGGAIPPSLDVYQFIWDRTRMVRKDFILQNYIGTGGKCSACAVRCHERIARWHAMAEHQLSHLPDFAIMQSQQNIQELGQTMKTLNQYYDDSERRSTVEEEDILNIESKSSSFRHGCRSNKVMGSNPIDFDGKSLLNDENLSSLTYRIIGTPSHSLGTAEPEMRGLYILLTLNNDGGMEVLKYAARLSVERPQVFHSRPVQLALDVYKARKERNYARFFTILRDPRTPYLFACVMFKYVEQMRKDAFQIMSKTFGCRTKSGETAYDMYPLQDLVHLLCFESMDEAREACEHYNITVKDAMLPDSEDVVETIFWRSSDFSERRDPRKGTVIPLRPWKMNRTIECKLGSVTRLAVCRGEVSGEGATLEETLDSKIIRHQNRTSLQTSQSEASILDTTETNKSATKVDTAEAENLEREHRLKIEKMKMLEMEQKRKEEELARKRAAEEEAQSLQLEKQRKEQERQALEEYRKQKAEEKKRKIEEEKRRAAEAKAVEERKKAIEREREKQRLLELAQQHQREEEERIRRLKLEQEEALLKLQEEERLRQLEIKRKIEEEKLRAKQEEELRIKRVLEEQELQIKKAKEEEKRRIELEWEKKLQFARKLLVMKTWVKKTRQSQYSNLITRESLERLGEDGAQSEFTSCIRDMLLSIREKNQHTVAYTKNPEEGAIMPHSHHELFYRTATDPTFHISLPDIVMSKFCKSLITLGKKEEMVGNLLVPFTLLVYIAGNPNEDLLKLLIMWLDSRLDLNRQKLSKKRSIEITIKVQQYSSHVINSNNYESILVLIPPSSTSDDNIYIPENLSQLIENSSSYGILNMAKGVSIANLPTALQRNHGLWSDISSNLFQLRAIDNSLEEICSSILDDLVEKIVHDLRKHPSKSDDINTHTLDDVDMKQAVWNMMNENGNSIDSPLPWKRISHEDSLVELVLQRTKKVSNTDVEVQRKISTPTLKTLGSSKRGHTESIQQYDKVVNRSGEDGSLTNKRHKVNSIPLREAMSDSKKFTNELRKLCSGDSTFDLKVGDSSLSKILEERKKGLSLLSKQSKLPKSSIF